MKIGLVVAEMFRAQGRTYQTANIPYHGDTHTASDY